MDDVKSSVKAYVFKELISARDAEKISDSTPLITGGFLSSLATVRLVTFLEETYGIAIEVEELDVERLNSIEKIAAFVCSKL